MPGQPGARRFARLATLLAGEDAKAGAGLFPPSSHQRRQRVQPRRRIGAAGEHQPPAGLIQFVGRDIAHQRECAGLTRFLRGRFGGAATLGLAPTERIEGASVDRRQRQTGVGVDPKRQRRLALVRFRGVRVHGVFPFAAMAAIAACQIRCATSGPSISLCAPEMPWPLRMNWLASRLNTSPSPHG